MTLDAQDKSNPVLLSNLGLSHECVSLAISGQYAYMASPNNALEIINIADPQNLVLSGEFTSSQFNWGLDVSSNYAYMTDRYGGFKIIDVSDSQSPELLSDFNYSRYVYQVGITGNMAIVADTTHFLKILNLSYPDSLFRLPNYGMGPWINGIEIVGNLALFSSQSGYESGLYIFDISNIERPVLLGRSLDTFTYAGDLAIDSTYVYLLSDAGFHVINISDPSSPWRQGHFYISNYNRPNDIAIKDSIAYVAANDSGLYCVSISDPSHPALLGHIIPAGYTYGVAIRDNYAFLGCGIDTLIVLDISDPTNPIVAVTYEVPDVYIAFRDIILSGDYAFITDSHRGLSVIDISNPLSPSFVTFFGTYGEVNGMAVSGNLIYLANQYSLLILRFNPETGTIEDITNLPQALSLSQNYPNPFNAQTTIQYDLPVASDVTLSIYDIQGRMVGTPSK